MPTGVSGTDAVVWTNTGAAFNYAGATVSNVERLLIQTGSGNDNIINSAYSTADDIRTGAGNDTVNGGAGADTLIGGTGDDTYIVDVLADVVTEAHRRRHRHHPDGHHVHAGSPRQRGEPHPHRRGRCQRHG